MNVLLSVEYDAEEYARCGHCCEGSFTYTLFKEGEGYAFEERFGCLSFDEPTILWRGTHIDDLIKTLEVPEEYNISGNDRFDLIRQVKSISASH